MKKLVLLFIIYANKGISSSYFSKIVDGKDLSDLSKRISTIGLNCASPDRWAEAIEELSSILEGVGRVVLEQGQTLLYKKDYPTVCHVLTQSQIDAYEDKQEKTGSKRVNKGKPYEINYDYYQPKPSYYWPKYFVEVSNKGNDAHSSFAKGNALYTANRKIANSLGSFFDIDGAVGLSSKLLGTSFLLKNLKAVDISIGNYDAQQLVKAAIYSPFEKMRLRANHHKTYATYEANIWPVGLSSVVGTNLSVCGSEYKRTGKEIGYSWPIKGIPMTCPVAMSKDAYSFWDTGMIDYLDPQAVISMAVSANPVSCGAAKATKAIGEMAASRGTFMGSTGPIDSAIGGLSRELSKALRPCSWPILGAAEAVARKAASLSNPGKWTDHYCTFWGPIAPKSSSSTFQNEFSYANHALKFKLLAHELFGTPRANKERWSLAYPWEGPGAKSLQLPKTLGGFDLSSMDKISHFFSGTSRAEILGTAGDLRLIDSSKQDLIDQFKNLAKEMAYAISLQQAGSQAGKAARKQYEKMFKEKSPDANDFINDSDNKISEIEKDTALILEENIYQEKTYCHVNAKGQGTIVGNDRNKFKVSYDGYSFRGGNYSFAESPTVEACWSHKIKKCRKRDHFGRCKKKREGQLIFYKKMVKIGVRKVKNPKIYKIRHDPCIVDHRNTATQKRDFVICEDKIVLVGKEDSRQKVTRPNPYKGKTITKRNDTANMIEQAAFASTIAGIELTRAKYSDITGDNHLPGKKRIYTIWEKIECHYPSKIIQTRTRAGSKKDYESCKSAVKFEVYKFIQKKLLRKICDYLGQNLGDPWL